MLRECGNVYDVTKYMSSHGEGDKFIFCKNASNPWVRLMNVGGYVQHVIAIKCFANGVPVIHLDT
jgi:hypothetical protein